MNEAKVKDMIAKATLDICERLSRLQSDLQTEIAPFDVIALCASSEGEDGRITVGVEVKAMQVKHFSGVSKYSPTPF